MVVFSLRSPFPLSALCFKQADSFNCTMTLAKTMYNAVFRRTSTTIVFVAGTSLVFERFYNGITDDYFKSRNAGRFYEDLPCSKEE
eukprot:m.10052 g.10052  ORF g.10052 m.10052 type:complete len:86 (-) comp6505_c0_seq1:1569-1826(-)